MQLVLIINREQTMANLTPVGFGSECLNPEEAMAPPQGLSRADAKTSHIAKKAKPHHEREGAAAARRPRHHRRDRKAAARKSGLDLYEEEMKAGNAAARSIMAGRAMAPTFDTFSDRGAAEYGYREAAYAVRYPHHSRGAAYAVRRPHHSRGAAAAQRPHRKDREGDFDNSMLGLYALDSACYHHHRRGERNPTVLGPDDHRDIHDPTFYNRYTWDRGEERRLPEEIGEDKRSVAEHFEEPTSDSLPSEDDVSQASLTASESNHEEVSAPEQITIERDDSAAEGPSGAEQGSAAEVKSSDVVLHEDAAAAEELPGAPEAPAHEVISCCTDCCTECGNCIGSCCTEFNNGVTCCCSACGDCVKAGGSVLGCLVETVYELAKCIICCPCNCLIGCSKICSGEGGGGGNNYNFGIE